ncbi:acyl carrier protein [Streptomyces sp. NBC_00285]|uniref:acyl carrier protein n=1 Tax=Streptomyces sp. NBC_00285 TaxID=2975700 RepID=UPI002E295963|nr:acyl carrier protein [Streptomyces sp. NBC_00285]
MPQTSENLIRTERLEALRTIVVQVLELGPDELTETSHFVDDHDADSLLALEILARIELDLGVAIPQEDLPEMVTLTAVYDVVARNADWEISHA